MRSWLCLSYIFSINTPRKNDKRMKPSSPIPIIFYDLLVLTEIHPDFVIVSTLNLYQMDISFYRQTLWSPISGAQRWKIDYYIERPNYRFRLKVFKKVTKTTKTLIPTFITPYGLYNNMYDRKINKQVTGNDLFLVSHSWGLYFLFFVATILINRSSGLEYLLKTDSNIIFFPPNGRYEGEKHYICKFLEIPAVILRSLNNRRQANNRSTAEEESLAYGIGNMTVNPNRSLWLAWILSF